jgi:arabinose-5-phosphate isomerase
MTHTGKSIAQRGAEVLAQEALAVHSLASRIGKPFEDAVRAILDCKGRTVLTGMGKTGIVARKVAATFASTGTPAFFMHPAEGLHGDLGMIEQKDLVIAISNSGNTEEILRCLPFFKRNGNFLIAMTGSSESDLAKNADIVLDVAVEREVCPLNLAPTSSTTVALAMGDALAVVLLELRGFETQDFALRHPSGTLGRRLLLRVGDLMDTARNPVIHFDRNFDEAVDEITSKRFGAVSIVDDDGKLVGILTDGDLRRILQRQANTEGQTVANMLGTPVRNLMTASPMHITPDVLAAKAVSIMEDGPRKVFVLPVVDEQGRPVAMIHLHDLVSAGV